MFRRLLGAMAAALLLLCVAVPWVRAQDAKPYVPMPAVIPATAGVFGLYSGADFRMSKDFCKDCQVSKQALWYFQNDWIATPKPGVPAAGFTRAMPAQDDVRQWHAQAHGDEREGRPNVLWLGSPQRVQDVRLALDGGKITFPNGMTMPFKLVGRIPTNLSYYNARSTEYFARRPLRMRGETQDGTFVARTIWPQDWTLRRMAPDAEPLRPGETLMGLVRKYADGRDERFEARVLWERAPGSARAGEGRAVLALMLNGAQGDDDEALSGHFAVVTGRHDSTGDMSDWMVNNFYALDRHSEKGVTASILPLDNYMTDLNSGQSWYRPSYMLVAVLKTDRAPMVYQGAISRVFNHFFRQDFVYRHASMNCAGISMDTLRTLGWNIANEGAESHLRAAIAYPYQSVAEMSFTSGKQAYGYLSAERSRLHPAVAFDAAGRDLLSMAAHVNGKTADNALRSLLRGDLEALIFVRLPQLPSSRPYGSFPAASLAEYLTRAPQDRRQWKIIPVEPRPFPRELIEPDTLKDEPAPPWLPAALTGGVVMLWWGWRRARKARRRAREEFQRNH